MITTLVSLINDRLIAGLNAILSDAFSGQESDAQLLAANPMMVEITDLKLRLLLTCINNCDNGEKGNKRGIRIHKQTMETNASLSLVGTSKTLMQLALAKDKQGVISSQPGLHLAGDTAALYAWQRALNSLSINWEGELTRHLGPLPASLLINQLRALKRMALQLNAALPSALHHSHTANDLALSKDRLEDFGQSLQELRNQADALRRRVNQLDSASI